MTRTVFVDKVIKFASADLDRASMWIRDIPGELYARKSTIRYINGNKYSSFEFASMNWTIAFRRKRLFTELCQEVTKLKRFDILYVECVHNKKFSLALQAKGWNMRGQDLWILAK